MLSKSKGKWHYDGVEVPELAQATELQAMQWEIAKLRSEKLAVEAKLATAGERKATNVEQHLDGSILTLRIDLAQSNGLTKGRKEKDGSVKGGGNVSIATTSGFMPVAFKREDGKDVQIGINVFAK